MNEIKSVVRKTIELVEEIKQRSQQLSDNIEKYDKQVAEQRLGAKQVHDMVKEEKSKLSEEVQIKANALLERLNAKEAKALERIESEKDPVTSDDVAELQLLSQLDTTEDELNKYIDKYKNNDLALRMVQKIAREQDIMISIPESSEDIVKLNYSEIKGIVNNYTNFSADTAINRLERNNMMFGMQLERLNSIH